ncbi:hypothetical protein LX36DRAFT_487121 [Colletotrichum falcatum]|nr:hypothetical protein LX36DRAFT_487121 [Colletotrichum falcatum]
MPDTRETRCRKEVSVVVKARPARSGPKKRGVRATYARPPSKRKKKGDFNFPAQFAGAGSPNPGPLPRPPRPLTVAACPHLGLPPSSEGASPCASGCRAKMGPSCVGVLRLARTVCTRVNGDPKARRGMCRLRILVTFCAEDLGSLEALSIMQRQTTSSPWFPLTCRRLQRSIKDARSDLTSFQESNSFPWQSTVTSRHAAGVGRRGGGVIWFIARQFALLAAPEINCPLHELTSAPPPPPLPPYRPLEVDARLLGVARSEFAAHGDFANARPSRLIVPRLS